METQQENPYASPAAIPSHDEPATPQPTKISIWSWLWHVSMRGALSGAILWIVLSGGFTIAGIFLQQDESIFLAERRIWFELLGAIFGFAALIGFVVGGMLGLMIGLLSYLVRRLRSRRRITLIISLLLPPAVLMAPFLFSPGEENPPVPTNIAAFIAAIGALWLGARIFWRIDDKLFASGREQVEAEEVDGGSP